MKLGIMKLGTQHSGVRTQFASLIEFVSWWQRGLLACIPQPLLQRFSVAHPELWLRKEGNELSLWRQQDTHTDCVSRYPLPLIAQDKLALIRLMREYEKVYLVVPKDAVLVHQILLPIQAESRLRTVVGFEVDRLTPYRSDEVYFDARLIRKMPEERKLTAQIVIAPKTTINTLLADFKGGAVRLHGVVVEGTEVKAGLLPDDFKAPLGRGAILRRSLWALTMLVCLLSLLFPLLSARQQANRLEAQANRLQVEMESVLALRDELDLLAMSSNYIANQRIASRPLLVALNELSRIVPDDGYIQTIELRDAQMTIRGVAGQAASLVEKIEESAVFQDVNQVGPIIPDGTSKKERFAFKLNLEPTGVERTP